MDDPACENCLHWREDEPLGSCHRYPPRVYVVPGTTKNLYPAVHRDDLCGEWKDREF